MAGRLNPPRVQESTNSVTVFCSIVYFAIIIHTAKLFHSSTGKCIWQLCLANETHSRLNLAASHSSSIRAAKRNRGCTARVLGERREPAAPFGKRQGRTNAGANHLCGRPLNGIPVWMQGLELKLLLSSPALPLTAGQSTNTVGYTLQKTCHCKILNICDCWIFCKVRRKKNFKKQYLSSPPKHALTSSWCFWRWQIIVLLISSPPTFSSSDKPHSSDIFFFSKPRGFATASGRTVPEILRLAGY